MKLKLNGVEIECAGGAAYQSLLAYLPDRGAGALGVCVEGRTVSLHAAAEGGADARILTYADEEGRRIYERTLQYVLIAAVARVAPKARVRIEHSFGQGLYVDLIGAAVTPSLIEKIEEAMRSIAREDQPLIREDCTKAEAIEYFRETGQDDKLKLFQYRVYENFCFYRIDGMREYFYGEMAPSTGAVGVFALKFYLPGLVLILPDPNNPDAPAAFEDLPKLMRTFAESARWCEILGCANAADLNEMSAKKRLREFIRVNEALHERSIAKIADQFLSSAARVILIAGPSSSGKTTLSHRLMIALRVLGKKPIKISLDDYYLDRDAIPVDENGERDFEKLETLDIKLLDEHLVRLLQGETVDLPQFDFVAGVRKKETRPLRADRDQPLVIEGIHALNDRLTAGVPREMKFKIYISALSLLNLDDHNRIRTTDVRLLRRIVRDYQFRGTSPVDTMAMWDSVRRGEENYIFPYQEQADAMFNSTLVYELPIMKRYVYPMLRAVPPDSPQYTRARRLVKFLNYIRTADVEDEIPNHSILREFIGGCCFYREED